MKALNLINWNGRLYQEGEELAEPADEIEAAQLDELVASGSVDPRAVGGKAQAEAEAEQRAQAEAEAEAARLAEADRVAREAQDAEKDKGKTGK